MVSTTGVLHVETEGADEVWLARMERQRELEREMTTLGMEAFQRRAADAKAEGRETETPAVQMILKTAVDPLAQAIREFVTEATRAKRGRKHRATQYLTSLPPEVISFITLKRMLDVVSQSVDLTNSAIRIAGAVEDEARFQKFEQEAKPLLRVIRDDLDKRSADLDWRRTVLIHAMNRKDISWEAWPAEDKLHHRR